MKRKYYLIDTENIGDRWFDLSAKIRKKDRIITFYTEHHSKRLEHYLLSQVRNKQILWLECMSGNNALDYQLVGVLSFLITKHPKASFCIYSNDKGYQNAVDFWKERGVVISQKSFSTADKKKKKKKKGKKSEEVRTACVKNKRSQKSSEEGRSGTDKPVQGELTQEPLLVDISKCLPMTNLGGWYSVLTAVRGQQEGRNLYMGLRENAELRAALSKNCLKEKRQRGVKLVELALRLNGLGTAGAEEAYQVIQSHSLQDFKGIKEELDKKFGKKPQQKYYQALRPLVRVIKSAGS